MKTFWKIWFWLHGFRFYPVGGGEDEPAPNSDPAPAPDPAPDPAPSAYDSLMSKKGFKTNDDFANSYSEAESALGRSTKVNDTVKKQLESHGYAVDDIGNITQVGQPAQQQNTDQYGNPVQQNQQYGQQQGDPIYDPYTGQQITDPVDRQLAQMPLSQRTTVIFNALTETREKQQTDSFNIEQEVLNRPEAKGFENDVRNVMMRVPLSQRTKKETWEDALLKVKGMKYDEAMKAGGQQAVEQFINKESNQTIPAKGGGGDNISLTQEQETTYSWYKQHRPTMFRDKKHFLQRATSNVS